MKKAKSISEGIGYALKQAYARRPHGTLREVGLALCESGTKIKCEVKKDKVSLSFK